MPRNTASQPKPRHQHPRTTECSNPISTTAATTNNHRRHDGAVALLLEERRYPPPPDFAAEANHGYLSRDLRYEIVPACAGVNFMIVVWCSLACGLMHTRRTLGVQSLWLVASALIAYVTTLAANATRIAIAIRLHRDGASLGWVTPDRIHAAAGVAVYFLFLCVIFAIGARMTGARRDFTI